MVSIKRYLNSNIAEGTLRQAVTLLIEKLGDCAVDDDPQELESFHREVGAIHEALTPDLPPENVLVLAESATQALARHNKRITRKIRAQGEEFQAIIRLFQHSLVTIAGETSDSFQSLTKIGEELERGTAFRDLPSLRLHLGKCLSGLREEIEREKTASKTLVEKFQVEIERHHATEGRAPQKRNVDLPTGSLCQEDCIAAIQDAIDRGTRHYAAVMVVNRFQPVNARFGWEAGDWMLSRFRAHVETQLLTSADRLFRWTGPAMVAILERPQPIDQVRALVRHMVETRIDETYEFDGRSILIPVSATWSVFSITPELHATEGQIQKFVDSQHCRDFA